MSQGSEGGRKPRESLPLGRLVHDVLVRLVRRASDQLRYESDQTVNETRRQGERETDGVMIAREERRRRRERGREDAVHVRNGVKGTGKRTLV